MTAARQSTLRERIVERMGDILKVIKPENKMIGVGPEGDVRPRVIGMIRVIANLAPATSQRHGKVEASARRLRDATRDLLEYVGIQETLEQIIAVSGQRARKKSVRVNWQRVLLAAHFAYNLLLEGGFGSPTLSEGGQYVRLTARLVEVATGRKRNAATASAARACAQHFKELKAERIEGMDEEQRERPYPYSKPGRQRAPRPPSTPEGRRLEQMTRADSEAARRLRIEEARSYPPLDELLDAMEI